jgi:predicted phage terminase large subunit-like protein
MKKIRPQAGRQMQFVTIKDDGLDENGKALGKGEEIDFIFFGGGGGGGKTWAILFDNLKYVDDPNYFSVFFRNTTIELETNLWPEALKMYEPILKYPLGHPKGGKYRGKAHINYQKHTITFPSGAKSTFSYMQHDKDADSWYGAELSRVYFDEFQRQSQYCFDVVRSRLRSKAKVKSAARMTLNPDSTHFVIEYVQPYLCEEGYPIPELAGKIRYFVMVQGVLYSSWDKQELISKFPDKKPRTYCYLPSTIEDNKILQELESDYKDSLDSLPEAKRKQLLLGCWYNTETGCRYFNREFVKPCTDAVRNAQYVRAWDLAGTEFDPAAPAGSYARNPDWTVGFLMSKSYEGGVSDKVVRYVMESMERDRLSSAKVEDLIFKTAEEDYKLYGNNVTIYLPTDPNPSSARYIKSLISELTMRGFRATTSKTNKAKVDRFIPFSVACENGLVQYKQAEWNKTAFQELEDFTGERKDRHKSHDDICDAIADAFQTLNHNRNVKPFSLPDCTSSTKYTSYRNSIK